MAETPLRPGDDLTFADRFPDPAYCLDGHVRGMLSEEKTDVFAYVLMMKQQGQGHWLSSRAFMEMLVALEARVAAIEGRGR